MVLGVCEKWRVAPAIRKRLKNGTDERRRDMAFLKKYCWAVFYGMLLTAFTVYVLLDTFVIALVYTTIPTEEPTTTTISESILNKESTSEVKEDKATEESTSSEVTDETTGENMVIVTDTTYHDSNIAVTLTEYREYDTSIYVADVKVSSPEYLQTALAKGAYGKNIREKTSKMAEDNNAVLAINGDFYGVQESGYVLRNGVLYRNKAAKNQEDLVIYEDGSFEIINEENVSVEELLADGAVQILSFGPGLVMDGEIAVTKDEEVGIAKASNPRTAIGVVDDLHYIFVVSDGRISESEGLTLYELAEFMKSLGVVTAYNLDGGGSATMYFNGKIINNPTTNGKRIEERSVSDIVYIGY